MLGPGQARIGCCRGHRRWANGDIAADEVDDRVKDFLPLHRPANPHGWWDNVVLLADGSGGIHPGERGPQLPAERGLIPFGWP